MALHIFMGLSPLEAHLNIISLLLYVVVPYQLGLGSYVHFKAVVKVQRSCMQYKNQTLVLTCYFLTTPTSAQFFLCFACFLITRLRPPANQLRSDRNELENAVQKQCNKLTLHLQYLLNHKSSHLLVTQTSHKNMNMNMNKPSGMSSPYVISGQMTFYWGQPTDILIPGWPGESPTMYAIALTAIFFISMLVEWLSHARLVKPELNDVAAGLLQTLMYAARTGLAYLVMLAVMSFNVGVFVVAIAGYAAGFMIFGSRVFKKSDHKGLLDDDARPADLPPFTC